MHTQNDLQFEALCQKKRLHFWGIGGISMSTLALIALRHGHTVSGYDRTPSPLTERLEQAGIRIFYEEDPAHLDETCGMVYTAAIPESSAELCRARELGIPCLPRAEYLGGIMTEYRCRIGVSGTHGKSTTTTMLASIFDAAGVDPTVACGAIMPRYDGAYRIGGKEHFLYEACEYTDSFLQFHPTTAVILNVEMDHVDYFHSMEQLYTSFRRSAAEAALLVIGADDPGAIEVAKGYRGRLVRAGLAEDADYRAENIVVRGEGCRFTLLRGKEVLTETELPLPGLHNIKNALCAAAAAIENGISPEAVSKGLSMLQGAKRRFQRVGEVNGAFLYDDYAHHPGEIEATLRAARDICRGKLICLFQPHTYSRTKGLLDDFARALSLADVTVLAPIYAAREKNTYGVDSADLAALIPGAVSLPSFSEIVAYITPRIEPGDLILTMGAGDINRVGQMLLKK